MLNDRERQCLASIEQQLLHDDPRLVARFRALGRVRARRAALRPVPGQRSVHTAGAVPRTMLACAMLLLLVGATTGAMPVVAAGVVVALFSLGVAATQGMAPGASPA